MMQPVKTSLAGKTVSDNIIQQSTSLESKYYSITAEIMSSANQQNR